MPAHQGQDLFALHILGAPGVFLDLGAADPNIGSNTDRLEAAGWSGEAWDLRPQDFSSRPRTSFNVGDARKATFSVKPDYLSIDCDDDSLAALENALRQDLLPKVITIEHDAYRLGGLIRDPQRAILKTLGYHLLPMVTEINGEWVEWEDWWVR